MMKYEYIVGELTEHNLGGEEGVAYSCKLHHHLLFALKD